MQVKEYEVQSYRPETIIDYDDGDPVTLADLDTIWGWHEFAHGSEWVEGYPVRDNTHYVVRLNGVAESDADEALDIIAAWRVGISIAELRAEADAFGEAVAELTEGR